MEEKEVIILDDSEEDEEKNTNLRNSARQRIMSDYWGDMVPNEAPKKRKSYDQERWLLQSRRKSSLISNLSEKGLIYFIIDHLGE